MKITRLETFLANAGQRNYLFVRLHTDTGLTGLGEATLEWQERAVDVILNDWAASRIVGKDPFDIEASIGAMIRDQYQGGSTVMTAISAIEIAMWDIVGKACGQPVYRLLGGRVRRSLPVYANGWYGGCRTPQDFAGRARFVKELGYGSLKFDPFTTAWKTVSREEEDAAIAIVDAVAGAVGPETGLMIEVHGRLAVPDALRFAGRLSPYNVVWCEEPVAPDSLDLLAEVKRGARVPIAAGERLYTLSDFARLAAMRACDVVQMDIAHCGGLSAARKVAAFAAVQDMTVSPHCSIGPVAYAAAIHFAYATQNLSVLESFAEFDVDRRQAFVGGWNPLERDAAGLRIAAVPEAPGLGIELDEAVLRDHPFRPLAFPSLWDSDWAEEFTGTSMVRKGSPEAGA